MAHDDEADGFLGITYIPHGHDHEKHPADENENKKDTEKIKKSTKNGVTNAQLEKMHTELAALEKQLQDYEHSTDERLQHLERMVGHPVTAEEKVYRIQEDS